MTASVRLAEQRDLGCIERIENDADRLLVDRLHPTSWETAPTGADRAAEPGFLLVAEHGGTVVGFAHVLEPDGLCHLEQLSVDPDHGRRGIGRTLLEAALLHARTRGHERLSLRTYADVPWNAPFYASAGFVEDTPTTPFHRSLVATEARLGIDRYGRRVQMTAVLPIRTAPADVHGGPGWHIRGTDLRPVVTDVGAFRAGLGDDPLAVELELLWTGQPEAALLRLAARPQDPRVRALSADCHRDLGDTASAVQEYDELVDEHRGTPREAVFRQHRGKALLARGDAPRAVEDLRRVVALRRAGEPTLLASAEQALVVAERAVPAVVRRRSSRDVRRILEALPDWFGDPIAIENYAAAAADPMYDSWLAVVRDEVVGVALTHRHFAESTELHLLAVDPAVRRKGVGRALVDHVAAELAADDCSFLTVHTVGPSFEHVPYAETRAFYRCVGFTPLEEHDGLDWSGPTLILVRPLVRDRSADQD